MAGPLLHQPGRAGRASEGARALARGALRDASAAAARRGRYTAGRRRRIGPQGPARRETRKPTVRGRPGRATQGVRVGPAPGDGGRSRPVVPPASPAPVIALSVPRPLSDHRGGAVPRSRCATPSTLARPFRGARVPPLLGRGASQHPGDRERGNRCRHRPHRGRDVHHPGGCGRHHAPEPRPARHRGAVRHPRRALSGADRPRGPRGARPAPTSAPRTPFAGTCRATPTTFRAMSSSCRATSGSRARTSPFRRFPDAARTCRSGSSVRACTARSSRRSWGFPTPSHPTSRRVPCCLRSTPTGALFAPPSSSRNPMPWPVSTCSRRRRTRRPAGFGPPPGSPRYGSAGGGRAPLPPPDDGFEEGLSPLERRMLDEQGACSAVGSSGHERAPPDGGVRRRFRTQLKVDEFDEHLMLAAQIFDHEARVRSFEIAMDVWSNIRRPDATPPTVLRGRARLRRCGCRRDGGSGNLDGVSHQTPVRRRGCGNGVERRAPRWGEAKAHRARRDAAGRWKWRARTRRPDVRAGRFSCWPARWCNAPNTKGCRASSVRRHYG